jgi:hypothetical protein
MTNYEFRSWCLQDGIKNGFIPISSLLQNDDIVWAAITKNDALEK